MVEKRTLVFAILGILVWATLATAFVSYYFIEQVKYRDQLEEAQKTLSKLTENYDASLAKRNMISGDYGVLLGEYQWFTGENYSSLMDKYEVLLANLCRNYSLTLDEFPELNTGYNNLLNKSQTLSQKDQVTNEEFASLLNDFYKLFTALATKESESFLGKVGTINASLRVDYGNTTIKWFNVSISSSATLFDLTKNVTEVEYTYWSTMEPGHILLSSINGYKQGYWVWYYWDGTKKEWIFGPVGCDAWIINNNGIYKWQCG